MLELLGTVAMTAADNGALCRRYAVVIR